MDDAPRPLRRHGPRASPCVDGELRVSAPERLRSIDVATLPYPGIATDYKPLIITMLAVADGVGIVTENLYPGPLPLRRGAAAPGRRHPHRRPPRRRARRAPPVGRPGAGPRHPRRRRAGGRRARRRGRDGRSPACTTSTAATTTSSVAWRPSAPPSNAAETRPPQTPTGSDRTTNVRSDPARAGCSEGVGALFPGADPHAAR